MSAMNKNVILIEPLVISDIEPGLFTIGNSLEPYALELLASALDAHNYSTEIVRQADVSFPEIMSMVAELRPLCVGISVLSHTASRARILAAEIKKVSPNTYVVVGGQHPSIDTKYLLSGCFDFAVLGEGEATLIDLLGFLSSNSYGQPARIQGIAYKSSDGTIVKTSPRPRIEHLDSLPLAKRISSFLSKARCWNLTYPPPHRQIAVAQIFYSRGCRHKCTFCVSPIVWHDMHVAPHSAFAVQYRSAVTVVREIRQLHDDFGVNYVYFTDLTFNNDNSRVAELCKALIAEGLHSGLEDDPGHQKKAVHWYALVKVPLDQQTASLMARAGCSKIGIGVEDFNIERTKAYQKPYRDRETLKMSLQNADSVGIIVRCLLMIGGPKETRQSIQQTIEALKMYPIDQVRVAFLTPYPNTPVFTTLSEHLMTYDLDLFDENHPVIQCDDFTPEELYNARRQIVNDFYGSNEYIARCQSKLERFPELSEAYHWFFKDLFRRSMGEINLLSSFSQKPLFDGALS
jgi:radical SAM superfamily enzyme YgiQ (UPF0313 family)